MQLSLFADPPLGARRSALDLSGEGAAAGTVPSTAPSAAEGRAASHLLARLQALGLPLFPRLATHRNQQVMISWTPGRAFRVHEGYADAPEEVLRAIVRFVSPGTRRDVRLEARRVFLAYPAEQHAPPAPGRVGPRPARPADLPVVAKLRQLHELLNARHFGGGLGAVELLLSGRMRRRLGEIRLERATGRPLHIAISRRHLRRDGWISVAQTLLHEMVHQWQAETGRPVDHGREFRRKAREVGIEPRAIRMLG